MNTKTIFSAQYMGHRYQLKEIIISSQFVTYSILQDRRVVKSRLIGRKRALLEFVSLLQFKVIANEIV